MGENNPHFVRPVVSVAYHMFPHYRAPIMRELSRSQKYEFRFWGSHKDIQGIKSFQGDRLVKVNHLRTFSCFRGFSVSGLLNIFFDDKPTVIILLGNPNIPQFWVAAIIGRILRKKVLFWGHGWLKKRENWAKANIRNLYFSLSNAVLVYGDRAVKLAENSGFNSVPVYPVYNSLDWELSSEIYDALCRSKSSVRIEFNIPAHQLLIICTARLTKICCFDLLLDAMATLKHEGLDTSLILVGSGPERAALEAQAWKLKLNVKFLGAIYNESRLAELLYAADLTVSPGKVGLTAMHSLSYGTPVVTHSDLDWQMPEVEAVIEGQTGSFFERGNADDLARAIGNVANWTTARSETRKRCRTLMAARYTPEHQRELIEAALDQVLGRQS